MFGNHKKLRVWWRGAIISHGMKYHPGLHEIKVYLTYQVDLFTVYTVRRTKKVPLSHRISVLPESGRHVMFTSCFFRESRSAPKRKCCKTLLSVTVCNK